jgi:transposase
MARPRQKIDQLGVGAELLARLKNEASGWQCERMLAIKLTMEGACTQKVADDLGRSQATIQTWINRFRAGGIDGLLTKNKGNGPQSRLTSEMEKAMIAELAKGKWRTARDAWNWLRSQFDFGDMKEATIYKYLGKCAGRLKATRPSNPQKDPAAQAAFRETLADKVEEIDFPAKYFRAAVGV